jgi:4'-phosphopantetheinyl transferase
MPEILWSRPSAVSDADRALLSGSERERMSRYQAAADRERFAAGWSLARRRLAELTGTPAADLRFDRSCEHCGDPRHGRPRLAGGGPSFSISHSGDRVVLAVRPDGPVGVDVERIGRDVDRVRRFVLHPDEPADTAGLDLLRLWVRKEAVLKAAGLGLAHPMVKINLGDLPAGVRVHDLDAGEGYLAAVATGQL